MRKTLLHKISSGYFNPDKKIETTIQTLYNSYGRAKETVQRMHSGDELTFTESMDREFRFYSNEIRKAKEKQFWDEQSKMFELRTAFYKEFGVDVWDEVILNFQFDTIDEFYDLVLSYVERTNA